MSEMKSRRGAVRGVAVLVVGFLAAGAFAIGPASAGKFLTKKKALKLFYTKAASDARFINVGETASDAEKLDGLDSASYRTRVAGATSDADTSAFSSPTYTSIHSSSITAPSNGFIFIVGSVGMEDNCGVAGSAILNVRLRVDATPVTNGGSDDYTLSGADCSGYPNAYGDSTGLDAVVPVTAGTHTIHIEAMTEMSTSAWIGARSLSLAFFPEGSGISIPVRMRGAETNNP